MSMTPPVPGASGAAIAGASGHAPPARHALSSTEAAPPGAADRPAEKDVPGATWPHHFLSLLGIRRWIAGALSPTRGPIVRVRLAEVYEAKTRAVTARFAVRAAGAPREDVVFKATLQPLFYYAPVVDRLVMGVCPEHVPELLAAEVLGGPTFAEGRPTTAMAPQQIERQQRRLYSLYRPFSGPTVRHLLTSAADGDPAALAAATEAVTAVSRAFARIQVGVAGAPPAAKETIPRLPVTLLPVLFDDLLRRIEQHYLPRWVAGGARYPPDLPEPRDAFAWLTSQRAAVAAWTDELAAGNWPETVDHVDLQPSNAVVADEGRVLLFDWEESLLTCPYFSIKQWMTRTGPCGQAARDAYLDALPWGTHAQRARALELAVRLLEIKDCHALEVIRDAEGFPGVFPRGPLQLIRRTRRLWGDAA